MTILLDRTRHLFFFLFDEKFLHRILLIMVHNQILKLPLLLQ